METLTVTQRLVLFFCGLGMLWFEMGPKHGLFSVYGMPYKKTPNHWLVLINGLDHWRESYIKAVSQPLGFQASKHWKECFWYLNLFIYCLKVENGEEDNTLKKKKKKKQAAEEMEAQAEEAPSGENGEETSAKKKKKRKAESEEAPDAEDGAEETETPAKKKKRKTDAMDTQPEETPETPVTEKKKKKKKKDTAE